MKKTSKKKKRFITKLCLLLIVLVILLALFLLLTPTESEVTGQIVPGQIADLELPTPIEGEQIIKHTGYVLSYNEQYELPSYVAYELTREEVYGALDRADSFKSDPSVTTGSATLDDYKKSGYDRGHMAPAADFKWSGEAMSDTFYLSNMAPQDPQFNRGIWSDLEAMVRQFAVDNGKVYVVTGPVLTDGPYKTIGKNKVAVPNKYYKVILDYTEPEVKAIGFLMPGKDSKESVKSFATSVDEVEKVTGLDFFPRLPDEEEEIIEANYDTSLWNFKIFNPSNVTEKTLIETEPVNDDRAQLISHVRTVLYKIKKEIISYLGLTKLAKELEIL